MEGPVPKLYGDRVAITPRVVLTPRVASGFSRKDVVASGFSRKDVAVRD